MWVKMANEEESCTIQNKIFKQINLLIVNNVLKFEINELQQELQNFIYLLSGSLFLN
jgi:hypothetical protein